MQILLIEDDIKIASFIVKGLKESGFAVHHETDGEAGLQSALAEPFDTAIVDIIFDQVELFWNRWKGPFTIYMITNRATYETLKNNPRIKLIPLTQDRKNIIVSNKAPTNRHSNSSGQNTVLSVTSGVFTPL